MTTRLAVCSSTLVSHYLSYILQRVDNIYSTSLVRIFSRLNDPKSFFLVSFQKSVPLIIPFFLNMISLRNMFKGLLANSLIKCLHVVVKSLFVGQIPVELQMIMDFAFISLQNFELFGVKKVY